MSEWITVEPRRRRNRKQLDPPNKKEEAVPRRKQWIDDVDDDSARLEWMSGVRSCANSAEIQARFEKVYSNGFAGPRLRSPEAAKRKLLSNNPAVGPLVDALRLEGVGKTSGVDFLLAGSTALSAVDSGFCGEARDLDFYAIELSSEKIDLFDRAVRRAFPESKVLLFRLPLTLNWWLLKEKSFEAVKIQLVLLEMRSWAEFWVTCHAHMVCLGYSVARDAFLTMVPRFETFRQWTQGNLTRGYRFAFSNLLNADSNASLNRAADKYGRRGYPTRVAVAERHRQADPDRSSGAISPESDGAFSQSDYETCAHSVGRQRPLVGYAGDLAGLCAVAEWVRFSNRPNELAKAPFVRALELASFSPRVATDKFPYDESWELGCSQVRASDQGDRGCRKGNCRLCPVDLEHHRVWAKLSCNHELGFSSYLKMLEDRCPLCRKITGIRELEIEPVSCERPLE